MPTDTTPTKNESLPELPEYAASLHVQHFRNAPSMRNTDFVESFDFPEGAHRLYTADQMRAYAEAALTREAPTEGVPDGDQQTIDALVDRIDWWADKYETEGGHGVIVQLLRQYAGMVAKIPTAALTEAKQQETDGPVDATDDADYLRHVAAKLARLGYRIMGAVVEGIAIQYAAMATKQQGPGEAVLDLPARVAGRDFAAGQSTRQVIGRAQAHYEVHHEGCLRHPHTGELRDYRDVESDPDGTLCVGPGPLPSADTRQWGNSVLAPMKTVFVIHRPNGTPFQRDDAMGILATESEAQAIRFAHAREDEGAQYVRYVATAPQVEAKRLTGGDHD